MEEFRISSLPVIVWGKALLSDPNSILVTSPSALKFGKAYFGTSKLPKDIRIINSSDEYDIRKVVEQLPANNIKTAYLLGGGQVIDIGRYLSSIWNLNAVAIPTIVSTDAFLVDCTGIRKNSCVSYVKSKVADSVVLDWDILSQSPWGLNVSGCGDVLSIFTGTYDWQLCNSDGEAKSDEGYNESVAGIAKSILKGLVHAKKSISTQSKAGLKVIVDSLALEVQLCNLYGNSRPEEGGEHFFVYCIENMTNHFMHGDMVGFATLLTGYLQGQDIKEILHFMNDIHLDYLPGCLTKKVVVDTLRKLPAYVKENNLRYSVYNKFDYERDKEKVQRFFDIVPLA